MYAFARGKTGLAWRRSARLAVALGALLAHGAASGAGDEQALRARVTAYWDARVARSEEVYRFYVGPELGGPKDRGAIGEFGAVRFDGYRIESIELDGDSARIRMGVDVRVDRPDPGGAGETRYAMPSAEEWQRICGTWYRKPLRKSLVRSEFRPSELGPVGEGGPDCAKARSSPPTAEAKPGGGP